MRDLEYSGVIWGDALEPVLEYYVITFCEMDKTNRSWMFFFGKRFSKPLYTSSKFVKTKTCWIAVWNIEMSATRRWNHSPIQSNLFTFHVRSRKVHSSTFVYHYSLINSLITQYWLGSNEFLQRRCRDVRGFHCCSIWSPGSLICPRVHRQRSVTATAGEILDLEPLTCAEEVISLRINYLEKYFFVYGITLGGRFRNLQRDCSLAHKFLGYLYIVKEKVYRRALTVVPRDSSSTIRDSCWRARRDD